MAADPQRGPLAVAAEGVGGVAHVDARVQVNVQFGDVELGVVLPAADNEASSGVVHILTRNKRTNTEYYVCSFIEKTSLFAFHLECVAK